MFTVFKYVLAVCAAYALIPVLTVVGLCLLAAFVLGGAYLWEKFR